LVSAVTEIDPKLAEIVRRLVAAYEPERIYLFGSRARGNSDPESDYDLMLIVPDSAPEEKRRSAMAYEKLWGTRAPVDVVVWTHSHFESRLHIPASLSALVVREGRLIHST
jgi:predicted nucleotidyltransferase